MPQRYEMPMRREEAQQLFAFWEQIFGPDDPDIPFDVFMGREAKHNRHLLYLERDGDILTGTCGITISRQLPTLAGIGEVATALKYRGRGIAHRLCTQALEDFLAQDGQAVFLGTQNPDAARIYHRLGWRKSKGADVWINIADGASPEEFLADHFTSDCTTSIAKGDASLRVPMIPLLLFPHKWQVLDSNVPTPMISTRYATQVSCMGLYRKYSYLLKQKETAWFAAKTDDGRIVGIATAFIDEAKVGRLDGFTHERFRISHTSLINAALAWCLDKRVIRVSTRISIEDEEKIAIAESLGFGNAEPDGTLPIGDRDVDAILMTLC